MAQRIVQKRARAQAGRALQIGCRSGVAGGLFASVASHAGLSQALSSRSSTNQIRFFWRHSRVFLGQRRGLRSIRALGVARRDQ